MAFIPWGDINSGAAQLGGLAGNAIGAAKNGFCDLYRRYPDWALGGGRLNNPGSSFLRGMWDTICEPPPGDPPLPSPQEQPFQGGQCSCTTYTVSYRVTIQQPPFDPYEAEDAVDVPGRVIGGRVYTTPDGGEAYGVEYFRCEGGVETGEVALQQVGFGFTQGSVSFQILGISGDPNNCGDPPPGWKPGDRRIPPPEETNRDIPIPDSNGNNFTLPFVFAPINIDGTANINIDGVDVNIGFDGISFNPEFNFPKPNEPNKPPENRPPRGDCCDIIRDIRDKVDEIDDVVNDPPPPKPPKPPSPPELVERPRDPSDPPEETTPGVKYVNIVITRRPTAVTQQSGAGAPDWFAAGWFEWKVQDGYLPRQPIHFDNNWYAVPENAEVTGYGYTLTNGAQGYAVVYEEAQS